MISGTWWRQAAGYVAAGIRICRQDIPGLVALVGLFMLPPLAAVVVGSQPGELAHWIANALPWITITLGNISIVLAVEIIDAGGQVTPSAILPAAVRWLPRYLWANGITTSAKGHDPCSGGPWEDADVDGAQSLHYWCGLNASLSAFGPHRRRQAVADALWEKPEQLVWAAFPHPPIAP